MKTNFLNSLQEKLPRWDQLLSYNKGNIFNISKIGLLAIPALASVAEALHQRIGFTVSLPINLFVSYVAALSYFSASMLVQFACPRHIRKWNSLEESLREQSPKIKASIEAATFSSLLDKEDIDYIKGFYESTEDDKGVDKALVEGWERKNELLPLLRLICTCLFLTSSSAVLYLALYDAPKRGILNTFLYP